jgi:hypothetical protein
MFVIQANTPDETRDAIVKWLNLMASNHRIATAKLAGMHKRDIETARATTYQAAADFWGNVKIEEKK